MRFPCSEVEHVMWFGMNQLNDWISARPEDFATGFLLCWEVFYEKFKNYGE